MGSLPTTKSMPPPLDRARNPELTDSPMLSFPEVLYRGLQEGQNLLENIVSFQIHGRAFLIHDETRFRNQVLPAWFGEDVEWEDFLEQLELYGFRRLENPGPDQGAYYHELFLRGHYELIERMQPQQGNRSWMIPEEEPDFSRMPWIGIHESSLDAIISERPIAPRVSLVQLLRLSSLWVEELPGTATATPAVPMLPLVPPSTREEEEEENGNVFGMEEQQDDQQEQEENQEEQRRQ